MAKSPEPTATEARVLCACQYGAPDDVITLSGGDLSDALAAGLVDDNPEAVAYAKTLAAPKEGV